MKNMETFFKDLFEEKELTNSRLYTFGLNHLARVKANNPGGAFNTLITATQTILDEFHQSQMQKQTSIGNRKADTLTKKQARKAFNAFIRQNEGTVRGKFGKASEAYQQFFPAGLSAFDRATFTQYEELVNNIVARATQYQADLGTAFKTSATGFAQAYLNAKQKQSEKKGIVSHTQSEVAKERSALTAQLTYNTLMIAAHFLLQPQKAHVYFNTSLLFAQHRRHVQRGKPAANTTATVTAINYSAAKFVWMKNKGATVLSFQMYLQGQPVGHIFTLEPGQEVHQRMDAFFSQADELRVTNHGNITGLYEVSEVA